MHDKQKIMLKSLISSLSGSTRNGRNSSPFIPCWGSSGGAKVLRKLSVPSVLLVWIKAGQRPIALAVGAGRVVWTFLLPLWETARYRLKYCLKGSLKPKQLTKHQPNLILFLVSSDKVDIKRQYKSPFLCS